MTRNPVDIAGSAGRIVNMQKVLTACLEWLKAREERKKTKIGSMRNHAQRIRDAHTLCDNLNEDLREQVRK